MQILREERVLAQMCLRTVFSKAEASGNVKKFLSTTKNERGQSRNVRILYFSDIIKSQQSQLNLVYDAISKKLLARKQE
jgi:hypothetical protein